MAIPVDTTSCTVGGGLVVGHSAVANHSFWWSGFDLLLSASVILVMIFSYTLCVKKVPTFRVYVTLNI